MTRSMRLCRPARIWPAAARPLETERRHSRIAALNIADMGSSGCEPMRS
jgi:hypothetical protein